MSFESSEFQPFLFSKFARFFFDLIIPFPNHPSIVNTGRGYFNTFNIMSFDVI